MPACIQELHSKRLSYPVLIGGAAINRAFSYRALYPGGKDSEEVYEPGVFYCKDAFEGLAVMDQLIDDDAHEALLRSYAPAPREFREKGDAPVEELDLTDDSVRSPARTDVPVPTPPFWGVRRSTSTWMRSTATWTRTCCSSFTGAGRGVKGEAWQTLLRDDFRPRLERMWREQTYLHPRALLGFFPCYSLGNDIVVLDPEDRTDRAHALRVPAPAQGRSNLPGRLLPPGGRWQGAAGELDVIAVQAVTVGSEVTELMAKLEAEGEFAEQLFVHGSACRPPRVSPSGFTGTCARCSASTRRRAAATRGATLRCPSSQST